MVSCNRRCGKWNRPAADLDQGGVPNPLLPCTVRATTQRLEPVQRQQPGDHRILCHPLSKTRWTGVDDAQDAAQPEAMEFENETNQLAGGPSGAGIGRRFESPRERLDLF